MKTREVRERESDSVVSAPRSAGGEASTSVVHSVRIDEEMPKRRRSAEETAPSSKRQQSIASQPPKADDHEHAEASASTSGSSSSISDALIRANGDADTQHTSPPSADYLQADMDKGTTTEVRAPASTTDTTLANAELVRLRKELEFKNEVTRIILSSSGSRSSE
jgi:hypothetical protein